MPEYGLRICFYDSEIYSDAEPMRDPLIFKYDFDISVLEKVILSQKLAIDEPGIERIAFPKGQFILLTRKHIDQYKDFCAFIGKPIDGRDYYVGKKIPLDFFSDIDYITVDLAWIDRGYAEIHTAPNNVMESDHGILDQTRVRFKRLKLGEKAEYTLFGKSCAKVIATIEFYEKILNDAETGL